MLRISLAFLSVALLLASTARAQMRGGGGGAGAMAMSGMGAGGCASGSSTAGTATSQSRTAAGSSIATGFGANPAAAYYGMGSTPIASTAGAGYGHRRGLLWCRRLRLHGRVESVCTGQQRLRKHRCRPRSDVRHERRLILLIRERVQPHERSIRRRARRGRVELDRHDAPHAVESDEIPFQAQAPVETGQGGVALSGTQPLSHTLGEGQDLHPRRGGSDFPA